MTGKRAKAPCGHEGVHITQNYVQCLKGCDKVEAVPEYIDPEDTKPYPMPGCPHVMTYTINGVQKCSACDERVC